MAILLGVVAALTVFVAALTRPNEHSVDVIGFQNKSDGFAELIAERRTALARGADRLETRAWTLSLPEAVATKLFPLKLPGQTYDEFSFYRYKGEVRASIPWAEHPNGAWHMNTNSIGTRDDEDPLGRRPDLRILVTGDSHTDGVCDNSESFCHRLEAALRAERPGKSIEAFNAGKGGYSFYNYLGVLERFHALELDPDVFVVAVYGGNDFEEVLTVWHYMNGTERADGSAKYWDKVLQAKRVNPPSLPQGMMAFKYFRENPEEAHYALQASASIAGEIVETCEVRGILPLFVYIPSKYELDPDAAMSEFAGVVAPLELTQADIQRVGALADRFIELVRATGAEVIDMRPRFRAVKTKLYWDEDHHIDVAAHQLIAAELQPSLDRFLQRQP